MRARANSSAQAPVEGVEVHLLDAKPLRAGSDDTARRGCVESSICVRTSTDNQGAVNIALFMSTSVPGHFELDSSKEVISNLEVLKLNSSSSSGDSTVSSIRVPSEVLVDSGYSEVGIRVRFAGLLLGEVVVEDSETIPTTRVSDIATELTKLGRDRANVQTETWTHSVILHIEPEAIAIGASSVVVNEDVIRMSDPERTRGLIGVEQGPTAFGLDDKVILQSVLGLGSVLNEDGVAHGIVSDVVLDLEVVDSMEGDSTIISLMDRVVTSVGLVNGTNHMEMNGIATQLESLTDIGKLNVLDSANNRFITRRMEHNVSTKHIPVRSLRITSVDDVSGKETNFSSHVDSFSAVSIDSGIMLV